MLTTRASCQGYDVAPLQGAYACFPFSRGSAPGYGPNASVDQYHPTDLLGYQVGHWNLELDAKVSQLIKIGSIVRFEPYIAIQNLLNNYDYGSNFDGQKYLSDGTYNAGTGVGDGFGTRLPGFQANKPRFWAIGAKVSF